VTFEEAHRRIKAGDVVALRRAVDAGLNADLANRFSWTLLMLTAIEGNVAIGELLLAHGANIHAANNCGDTALSLAAHAGHEPFIKWLMKRGATTDCQPHGWRLAEWVKNTSGLPSEKAGRVLALLGHGANVSSIY
jgi:ankyrin repeat protein